MHVTSLYELLVMQVSSSRALHHFHLNNGVMYLVKQVFKNPQLNKITIWKELWLTVQRNSSFNSESSPLVSCKISRLGNYQNMSYKQFLKWEITFVVSLSVTFINKLFIYNITKNRPDFQVAKNNKIFY